MWSKSPFVLIGPELFEQYRSTTYYLLVQGSLRLALIKLMGNSTIIAKLYKVHGSRGVFLGFRYELHGG